MRRMVGGARTETLLFAGLLGLLAVSLGGSVWAWVREAPCGSCAGARDLLGGRTLSPLGVSYYGGLLALGVFFGRSRLLSMGVLLAASVHGVLLIALAGRDVPCGPCTLAGSAAVLAGILCLLIDPDNLVLGSVVLPIGAILTHAALFVLAAFPMPPGEASPGAVPQALVPASPATGAGTAQLLVFTRTGCRYCEEFEESVLPELRRAFGDALVLERRPAPPGLPSPTIVVCGAVRSVFPGLPKAADLRGAILRALGKEIDEQTLLSQPR